jgi:hypothetical protein
MPLSRLAGRLLVAGSALFLASTAAQAQIRYIASTGDDARNCATAATACRSLQRGIRFTPDGGELRILDSGFFGGGVINKTMTISADSQTVVNSPLTIDAVDSVVTLRGLSLNGYFRSAGGIQIANADAVHLENCRVEHFTGTGIDSTSNGALLFVIDSVVRENGGVGLHMIGTTGTRLTVDNSRFDHNGARGILVEGGVAGSVSRTIVSGNVGDGISWSGGQLNVAWSVATNNGGAAYAINSGGRLHLVSSVARGSSYGLFVNSSSLAWISNFEATENGTNGVRNYGTVYTRQNNTVSGNAKDWDSALPVPLSPI